MNKAIKIFIVVLMFGAFASNAQTPKLAHIDYLGVIDSLPSKTTADKEIEKFMTKGEKTLQEMQQQYQKDLDAYLAEQDSLSKIMRELREKELMQQQEILRAKSESLQSDLQVLNERAYKDIEKRLDKAIKVVAEKHDVTYVLEKSSLLYVGKSLDLTDEVRQEMMKTEPSGNNANN